MKEGENFQKAEEFLFNWLDSNPSILMNYVYSHASQNVIEDLVRVSTFKKSQTLFPSQHCSSRMNSISGPQSIYDLPIRKISSSEFEPLAFHPILSTSQFGCQSFLSSTSVPSVSPLSDGLQQVTSEVASVDSASIQTNGGMEQAEKVEGKNSLAVSFAEFYSSDMFQELVLDIWHDSDLSSLCFKILRNTCLLLNADRASLFIVEVNSSTGERFLVSRLFDVTAKSVFEDVMNKSSQKLLSLPFGIGIIGWVAQTGEGVNISNAYEDARFDREVDVKTGFHTRCLICMPIKDGEGNVLAVAQVMNKQQAGTENSDLVFSAQDVSLFRAYTNFCGIGLYQARILFRSQLETRRSQVLLELARLIFADQSDITRLIYTILMHSQSLLTCQRCQILLVNDLKDDTPDSDVFDEAYDYTWKDQESAFDEILQRKHGVENARFPINTRLTCHVARTGETINISNVTGDSRFDPTMDCKDPEWRTRSILCMPIRHTDGRVLGVCQLVNKSSLLSPPSSSGQEGTEAAWQPEETWSGTFSRNEEALFEAFALFAGLGIANTQMYEQIRRAEAKQRIAFDVLSYHATAAPSEAAALAKELVPSSKYYKLTKFYFSDLKLSTDETLKAVLRMFSDLGLIYRFRIDYTSLCRWVLSVKKNYRAVTYHNWRHAFNVAQTMFAMFKSGGMQEVFSDLECLSIIIACLSHDLDHRGTNNQFQIQTMSPLVNLYSTSVLEHHHFDQCIMLLNTRGTDILCNLSHDEYRKAVNIMEKAILATDLSRYFARLPEFRKMLDERLTSVGEGESKDDIAVKTMWQTEAPCRELLMSMMMTASDISASTKPWPVQKKSAEMVSNEFFEQGDLERQKFNIKPCAMMDREMSHKFPQMQIDFIEGVCTPVYQLISRVCGRLKPLLDGCQANKECWNSVANGEPIKEDSMRLPTDVDGADASYREHLMGLLNTHSGDPNRASPASQTLESSNRTISLLNTAGNGDETTSSTTVGGGRSG
nr:dual 3'5' cyclic AMP and GMP phosphodiesterase [Hymenolepis microstoma]